MKKTIKRSVYKKGAWDIIRAALAPLVFTVVIMGMILYGLDQTEQSSKSEGLRVLEESIRRAVVVSYAVEGRYPESIEYLENNYGIRIDRTKYAVHYSIFATNLMPDITVIEVQGVGNRE